MNVYESLGDVRSGFEDALDQILGTRKAVCPHCKKIVHLVKGTNVIAPHVYMKNADSLDFNDILDCPASGRTISIKE